MKIEWSSPDQKPEASPPQDNRPVRGRWPWILAALFVLALVALAMLYRSNRPVDEKLLNAVQLYVEAEQRAVIAGDDATFFSMQAENPAWRSSQIGLARDLARADNVEVIDAEEHGNQIWAVLRFRLDGTPIQRQVFFERGDGRLLHVGSDPDFWGRSVTQAYPWGTLQLHRVDQAWGETVGDFVTAKRESLCRDGCVENRQPFKLILSADNDATAAPGEIRMPSPRLIGLDGAGNPSPLFWTRLSNELGAYLQPATIRFAAPDAIVPRLLSMAVDFAMQHSGIEVDVVPFSQLPAEADQMLRLVDGAYLQPTPALIASDHIHDLTALAESDPKTTLNDFYAPMLAASRWRGRLWALPLSAEMRLIYYDRPTFAVATLSPESYLAQIWLHTLRGQTNPLQALSSQADGTGLGDWAFLDPGNHSLYAYAFAQRCAAVEIQPCTAPLREEDLAAALIWYDAHVVQDGTMPDLTSMDERERAFRALNWLSIPRETPMWVDLPAFYEHTNQLGSVGILSLQATSGNGAKVGPVPLQIHSGVISQAGEHPVAVWTWLNYLSRRRPVGPVRGIPARPSVAAEINYWATLPPALGEPMSAAFADARAVGIAEAPFFGWDVLADLVGQQADPEEIAAGMMQTDWFAFD